MEEDGPPPPSSPSSPVSPSGRAGKPRSRRAAAQEAAAPRPPATERELAIAEIFAGPQRTFSTEDSAALRAQAGPHSPETEQRCTDHQAYVLWCTRDCQ